jgi:hypothetical protein
MLLTLKCFSMFTNVLEAFKFVSLSISSIYSQIFFLSVAILSILYFLHWSWSISVWFDFGVANITYVNLYGQANGIAKGGAPCAKIVTYKICWPNIGGMGGWRAPKSRGETKLKVSQSQVAESRLGSTLPASNSRKG